LEDKVAVFESSVERFLQITDKIVNAYFSKNQNPLEKHQYSVLKDKTRDRLLEMPKYCNVSRKKTSFKLIRIYRVWAKLIKFMDPIAGWCLMQDINLDDWWTIQASIDMNLEEAMKFLQT
jgi:ribosomal protein L33